MTHDRSLAEQIAQVEPAEDRPQRCPAVLPRRRSL